VPQVGRCREKLRCRLDILSWQLAVLTFASVTFKLVDSEPKRIIRDIELLKSKDVFLSRGRPVCEARGGFLPTAYLNNRHSLEGF